MTGDDHARSAEPVRRVHRVGAGLLGAALTAFGVMGFARGLPFLSVDGPALMGMGSNGLLATISVVVGLVLVAAARRGGAVASTTMTTLGVLFLVSGLANLAVLVRADRIGRAEAHRRRSHEHAERAR